jgi:hypothetical protein
MNKIPQKTEKAKPFVVFIKKLQLKFEDGLPNGYSAETWRIASEIIDKLEEVINGDICLNQAQEETIESVILSYSQSISEKTEDMTLSEIILHLTRTINEIRIHCGMCINTTCKYRGGEDDPSNQFPTKKPSGKNEKPQDFIVAGFQSPETQTKLPIPRPLQTPSNNHPIGFRPNQES